MAEQSVDRPAIAAALANAEDLAARANVVGGGAGRRTVGGRRTAEPAVVVYVSRKVPREELHPRDVIPREVEGVHGPVPTDVVEAAPMRLALDTSTYRPLHGGCAIGSAGGAGT